MAPALQDVPLMVWLVHEYADVLNIVDEVGVELEPEVRDDVPTDVTLARCDTLWLLDDVDFGPAEDVHAGMVTFRVTVTVVAAFVAVR